MFKAGRMIKHAGRWVLRIGANDSAQTVFERLYKKLTTPARLSVESEGATQHADTPKPLRRTCRSEVARPEIDPKRKNGLPKYTRLEI